MQGGDIPTQLIAVKEKEVDRFLAKYGLMGGEEAREYDLAAVGGPATAGNVFTFIKAAPVATVQPTITTATGFPFTFGSAVPVVTAECQSTYSPAPPRSTTIVHSAEKGRNTPHPTLHSTAQHPLSSVQEGSPTGQHTSEENFATEKARIIVSGYLSIGQTLDYSYL